MPSQSSRSGSRSTVAGVRDGSVASSVRTLASLSGPTLQGSAGTFNRSRMQNPYPASLATPRFVEVQTSAGARLNDNHIRRKFGILRPPSTPARSPSPAGSLSGRATTRPPIALVDPVEVRLQKVSRRLFMGLRAGKGQAVAAAAALAECTARGPSASVSSAGTSVDSRPAALLTKGISRARGMISSDGAHGDYLDTEGLVSGPIGQNARRQNYSGIERWTRDFGNPHALSSSGSSASSQASGQ